jgi:hypothetical protein
LRGKRCTVLAQSEQDDECEDVCFMGAMLQLCADQCAVPKHGTVANWHLRHILENIACSEWRCSKGSMDDADSHGYRFDNAVMTESYGVELGPLPLPVFVLGLGGRNRIEAREVV